MSTLHEQKVAAQGLSGTSIGPTPAPRRRNAAQQKVCGLLNACIISPAPPGSSPPLPHPPNPKHHQHRSPAEKCGLWPHFRLAGGGVLTATQWGSFSLQRRARPEAPNNALSTVGAPSLSPPLPPPLLLLFLLSLVHYAASHCPGPRGSPPTPLPFLPPGRSERWRR